MTEDLEKNADRLDKELDELMAQNADSEFALRQADLKLKVVNAKVALMKAKTDLMKTKNDEQRIMLDFQRLKLDEFNLKYKIASDLSHRSDKVARTVTQTMIGLFPEEDKEILAIMKAAERVREIKEQPH